MTIRLVLVLLIILIAGKANSQKSAIAREVAEYLLGRFGREATEMGVETMTKKVGGLTAKYGDDTIAAVKKVGPSSFKYIEEAGEQGGSQVVKIMAKYGEESIHVITKPGRMAIFLQYGDDAAAAMLKHGGLSDPLIKQFGSPAASALSNISSQNARRIAMMAESGELATIGKTPEVLSTIGKYGDKAMEFVWKNKGALATTSAITAFIADPEPFINGVKDIAKVPVEKVSELPNAMVETFGKNTNFTLIAIVVVVSLGGIAMLRMVLKNRLEKAEPPISSK